MARIKWKILLVLTLALGSTIYMYKVFFDLLSCDSDRYTAAVCKQYSENAIAGTLCEELCARQTLVLSRCTLDFHGYRIFHQQGFDIKVSNAVFASGKPDLDNYYAKPSLGVSTDEFRTMMNNFLFEKLGQRNHSSFIDDLVSFGDANRDGQLTLAEAKSLWAIIQHREFLIYFILRRRHSRLVPQFYGFCGDLVAVEPLAVQDVFWLPVATSTLINPIVGTLSSYGWSNIETSGRHSLALVESAADLFGDGSDALYVCNAGILDMYRLDAKGNVRMTNFGNVYSQHEINVHTSGKSCSSVSDCGAMGLGCEVACSKDTRRCLLSSPPVVHRICEVIVPYVIPGAVIEGSALSSAWGKKTELFPVLSSCLELNSGDPSVVNVVMRELRTSLSRLVNGTLDTL